MILAVFRRHLPRRHSGCLSYIKKTPDKSLQTDVSNCHRFCTRKSTQFATPLLLGVRRLVAALCQLEGQTISDKPAFWFPVKRYGWGWGFPVRWEGWVVLIGYVALVIGGLTYLRARRAPVSTVLVYFAALTVILLAIMLVKGERPLGWRWGRR